jgi:GNAT superfamily N-acetyltransferase
MSGTEILRVRSEAEREAVRGLVWSFIDLLRERYPERLEKIDAYVAEQDIAGQLADFDAYFVPPHGECFLAKHDGAPVGIVMIRPRADGNCELNRMYVVPEARGLRIGRRLCEAAVAEARALGYPAVILGALDRHVEAIPLYRSIGFRPFRPVSGDGAGDAGVIRMRLDFPHAEP